MNRDETISEALDMIQNADAFVVIAALEDDERTCFAQIESSYVGTAALLEWALERRAHAVGEFINNGRNGTIGRGGIKEDDDANER